MTARWPRHVPLAAAYAAVGLLSLAVLTPLLWTVATALKPDREIYSRELTILPAPPTLANFTSLGSRLPQFGPYLVNSLVVAAVTVVAVALIASLAAFPLARLRFVGRRPIMAALLACVGLPYVLYLIPVYRLDSTLGLLNTLPGLILPYIALNLPMAVLLMHAAYSSLPQELLEAPQVDGAGILRSWWHVLMPLAGPGVASVVIFTFIAAWEEFLFAVTLLNGGANTTFAVGITYLRDEGGGYSVGPLSASVVVAMLPALAIFVALQRYFVRGLLDGGVKQ